MFRAALQVLAVLILFAVLFLPDPKASCQQRRSGQDTTPPVVSITSPAGGIVTGTSLTVHATATDNVGVDHVDFYVDGAFLRREVVGPYETSVSISGWSIGSNHTLQCKAYDAANNVGTSSVVTVTKG